ncbi:MAG: threonylcarbamoyl-AMP synthase [Desulfobacterales bacterium]|nr:threonylcarbamoyl-AMP synthase [Desulfobacterales bacterium]
MQTTDKTIKIDPQFPGLVAIEATVKVLNEGGIISFPTRHLYGIGADALNPEAVERVYNIKGRPMDKPLSMLILNKDELKEYVEEIPPVASTLMEIFWPGKLTLIFKAKDTLPQRLIAGTGKIGIRLPEHPFSRLIMKSFKRPITATSANLSGQEGCFNCSELEPSLIEKLDLIIDAGQLKGGLGSTVVDVTNNDPQVIREGTVSAEDLFAAL